MNTIDRDVVVVSAYLLPRLRAAQYVQLDVDQLWTAIRWPTWTLFMCILWLNVVLS